MNEQLTTLLATIERLDVVICPCIVGPHIEEEPSDNCAYVSYEDSQNAIEKAYQMGFTDGKQSTYDCSVEFTPEIEQVKNILGTTT